MADTTTTVLGLIKPEVGASRDTWGQKTNDNWDKVDAAVANATFPAGTRAIFQQTSAPTGWTKDTTQDNKALRLTNGAAGTGGSIPFTSCFAGRSASGSSNPVIVTGATYAHALSIAQMPYHTHSNNYRGSNLTGTIYSNPRTGINALSDPQSIGLTYEGGSEGHSHGIYTDAHSHTVSTSVDLSVTYIDVIVAVKN